MPPGWSAPGSITRETKSLGVQVGGEEIDLVVLSYDKQLRAKLLSERFTLGTDASAVWGNGRTAHDDPSIKIVVYGRAKGAFAGFGDTLYLAGPYADSASGFLVQTVPIYGLFDHTLCDQDVDADRLGASLARPAPPLGPNHSPTRTMGSCLRRRSSRQDSEPADTVDRNTDGIGPVVRARPTVPNVSFHD